MTPEVETLAVYGGRQPEREFRVPADVAEMRMWCESHSQLWFRSLDGSARQCKRNGAVRAWKRDANRIEVPVKYGLYEYGTFNADDLNRILIPVVPNGSLMPTLATPLNAELGYAPCLGGH
jgi:hypothetical protein